MKLVSAILTFAALGLIAADAPANDDAAGLKGKWKAVSIKAGGQVSPAEDVKRFQFSFTDKTYTNTIDDKAVEEGAYATDDSKTPKAMDFDIKTGQDEGKKQLGIYKLDGDKLTIVVAQGRVDGTAEVVETR